MDLAGPDFCVFDEAALELNNFRARGTRRPRWMLQIG